MMPTITTDDEGKLHLNWETPDETTLMTRDALQALVDVANTSVVTTTEIMDGELLVSAHWSQHLPPWLQTMALVAIALILLVRL